MNTLFKKTLISFIFAMFFTGCHAPRDNNNSEQTFIPDSVDLLLETTGDAQIDSLLQIAATAQQDTNLARLYSQIGDMYQESDFERAKTYYLKINELSEWLGWNEGHYLYATSLSNILNREGLNDSALTILRPALELAKREKDEIWTGCLALATGNAYLYKEWNATALTYYLEALSIFERVNDENKLGQLYYLLCQVYGSVDAMEKVIEYGEKAVALKPEDPYTLFSLGRAYSGIHQYEKAREILKEALRISEQQNNRYMTGSICYALGDAHVFLLYDLETAEMYLRRALAISKEIGDATGYGPSMMLLSKLEQMKGHFAQSETLAREALQFAEEYDAKDLKRVCYMILSELSVAQHKYNESIQYWEEMDLAELDMARETALRASEEMTAKYETEKKEIRITALEEERLLIIWLGIAGGVVLLLALAVFFFLWRWTVQKRRITEQQRQFAEQLVKQLEQEKQLIATQSLLDGETQERSRIARDLHDGLGSILTGTRMNLQEMKKDVVLSPVMLERYNTAYTLLDEAVHEMRRIAHHLMPESLTTLGLKQAASDFCLCIPQATFYYFGDETRFDAKIEIVVYRIMHELVNNALKHSGATHILVQIIHEADVVSLTVQDNGCGFDPAMVSQGMGLTNIRTRVTAFNGNLMIDTQPGVGTEINVDLRIEN